MAQQIPAHGGERAWPAGFGSQEGVLTVGNRKVTDWVAEFGQTPLFLYDRALIAARVAELRAVLPPGIKLHYAIKANPMPAVVSELAGLVDGLDVASGGELKTALASGMSPQHISFAGPGKRDQELQQAVQAGITLNIESEGEMSRLARIAQALGMVARVAIRVNPDFDLKGAGMRMGGGAKPFGVDAERVPAMMQAMPEMPFDFQGFHIFTGSQSLSAQALIEAQDNTLALAARLARSAPSKIRSVNIGGGFGLPYGAGDTPLDVSNVAQALGHRLARLEPELADAEIILELGRYLVGEAGVYLTSVIDRKQSHGEVFLITDGGLHHQLAASGNFGQVIRRNYPVCIATQYDKPSVETAHIVGCLCTPLDRLAEKLPVPKVGPGDLVAVFMAGAYGLTASPSRFLGHDDAREYLV